MTAASAVVAPDRRFLAALKPIVNRDGGVAQRRRAAAAPRHRQRFSGIVNRPSLCLLKGKITFRQMTAKSQGFGVKGQREATMDFNDKRLWYGVAAVIVVLLVIAYAAGWFGGTPPPAPQQ